MANYLNICSDALVLSIVKEHFFSEYNFFKDYFFCNLNQICKLNWVHSKMSSYLFSQSIKTKSFCRFSSKKFFWGFCCWFVWEILPWLWSRSGWRNFRYILSKDFSSETHSENEMSECVRVVRVCVCVCVCLSSVSLSLSVCVCVYFSFAVCLSVCLSVSLFISLCECVCVWVCVFVFIYIHVSMSLCLSFTLCLFVYAYVFAYTCVFICL
jgi:hypothetical protein